jgi:UDP-N-acetylmuramate: L-alanyl-gamma-D-glutamyl-meso-diaminopimelate ligase
MRIHFIGMGDRIMGDLATALCQKGHQVTGSDLSFSKLALSGLESMGLVPEQLGWFPQKITSSLDKVIVGRQVYPNNPELLAAQQLGLPSVLTLNTFMTVHKTNSVSSLQEVQKEP